MDRDEIIEKLSMVIKDCMEQDITISEDTDLFDDLGVDSLAVMQILAKVEEEFQIEFEDVDLLSENFNKVGDFCTLIEKQLRMER